MGFWHTGYMEFHEPSGFENIYTPQPTVYHCPHCHYTSLTTEDIRRHRFESHPYSRPILFVKGTELGSTTFKITSRLLPSDISTERCTRALINGIALPISELGDKLSQINSDTITVQLEGDHVSAMFKLRFEIANEEDLVAVDRNFFEIARGLRLDMRAIEQFIHASKRYSTAIGYCDGICEYFYGVLAKERSPDSTIPYEAYQGKFNRAADELKAFDRPLARILGALIAFHFNHFVEARNLAGSSRVGVAANRFAKWLTAEITQDLTMDENMDSSLEKLVTDIDSERLIRWSISANNELSLYKEEIASMLHKEISDFDKAKAQILLGQLSLYQGDTEGALRYAKEFRNSPTMGIWAEHVIEVCKNMG